MKTEIGLYSSSAQNPPMVSHLTSTLAFQVLHDLPATSFTLPSLTWLQPPWPPSCSEITADRLSPQGLCTYCFLCLECSSPDSHSLRPSPPLTTLFKISTQPHTPWPSLYLCPFIFSRIIYYLLLYYIFLLFKKFIVLSSHQYKLHEGRVIVSAHSVSAE